MPLDKYRKQIDDIDRQLITLLHERMVVVENVGVFKKINKIEPLDEARWQEVLYTRLEWAKKLQISEKLIKRIWEIIHTEALRIEKRKSK
ncbi:chorismate mutase [Candidatus Woesebacteria bacterium]|nr:chorismate mutase [Candidatus Woesebacteria bacterium]